MGHRFELCEAPLDVAALARANAYLVADAERAAWERGDEIPVLMQ